MATPQLPSTSSDYDSQKPSGQTSSNNFIPAWDWGHRAELRHQSTETRDPICYYCGLAMADDVMWSHVQRFHGIAGLEDDDSLGVNPAELGEGEGKGDIQGQIGPQNDIASTNWGTYATIDQAVESQITGSPRYAFKDEMMAGASEYIGPERVDPLLDQNSSTTDNYENVDEGDVSRASNNLREGEPDHHNPESQKKKFLICYICNHSTTRDHAMARHVQKRHEDLDVAETMTKIVDNLEESGSGARNYLNNLVCPICNFSTAKQVNMRSHVSKMYEVANVKGLMAQIIDGTGQSEMGVNGGASNYVASQRDMLVCYLCHFSTEKKYSMNLHLCRKHRDLDRKKIIERITATAQSK